MKKTIIYLTLLIAFFACTKEQGVPGSTGPQGATGANGKSSATDTASIMGKLVLIDEFSQVQNDFSGVTVTLSSGSQTHSATTGTTGSYTFAGMPTGTYDLTFQKQGYGTMKLFGLSNFGGGTLPTQIRTAYLAQIPIKTAPSSFTLVTNNSSTTTFDLHLDTSSLQYVELNTNILVYISKDPTVGPSDYLVVLNASYGTDGSGGYTVNFTKSGPNTAFPPSSINSGDKLYAVAYSYNYNVYIPSDPGAYTNYGSYSYYIDPQTGKIVYPNLSQPSNIVTFIF
jgi:hypothetical protein